VKIELKDLVLKEKFEQLKFISNQLKLSSMRLETTLTVEKVQAINDEIENLELLISRFKDKYLED
jgi:hypothetical protein